MLPILLELPEKFLDEEVRCNYVITCEKKKIWAVELDLLNEFINVCRKYQLKFFAAGGTMLGAVRHKGIIPWDDDIDIMMFRDEYDKLCDIAPHAFSSPYFFQTEETDPGSYRGHAQLRNSDTTAILKKELHQKRGINQGVFIDIFPLDNLPDNPDESRFYRNKLNKLRNQYMTYLRYSYPYKIFFRKNLYLLVTDYLRYHFTSKNRAKEMCASIYEKYVTCLLSLRGKNTQKVMMTPFTTDRWILKRSDLQDVIDMPFEMLKIPVPVNYDNILKEIYGNWRKFVVGGSVHGEVLFDTNRSYKEHI